MTDAERLYLLQIKLLPRDDRLRLAHRILHDLVLEGDVAEAPGPPSLADLYGVGGDVWSGVDPDQYVNEIRDEWERGR